jgi:cold shock CspA family protein
VSGPVRQGVVADFDAEAGLGAVVDDEGGRWPFHCTAIADGSRSIAPATVVTFQEVPGHLGRWEAADLRPLTPPA